MSWIAKITGLKGRQPIKRVRICVECGMPIDEHKDWCSILKIQQALARKALDATVGQG